MGVRNLKIRNGDGIDIDHSENMDSIYNVVIDNCVIKGREQWKQMFITHDGLINGGKLVLPDFKTEEKSVDKAQKLLIMREKEKSTVFA